MKKHTVTIKDIARELGIAPSTVSRALKDHFEISEETREKVKRVAKEMNYEPNSLALSLKFSKSNTIGVVVPEIVHFFFSTIISGIEDIAHSRGYNVIITQSSESFEREKMNLQTLYNNRVDGVLISISRETNTADHLKLFQQKGMPIVLFDRVMDNFESSKVTVNDFNGGYFATSHLIKQGYERIAHLAGPLNLILAQERLRGYKEALKYHGREIDEKLIISNMASNEMDAYKAVLEILKANAADAIFAINDMAAIGAMKAARKWGIRIPEDFGIVGFSNWLFTSLTNPTITTVEQPGFEMGQHAAELLIAEIESREPMTTQKIILETDLIIRESSVRDKS